MKRDFDYVSMADYSADMEELASQGAGIIERQQDEIRQLKTMMALLIEAAGGEIIVRHHHMRSAHDLEMIVSEDVAEDARRFVAKRKVAA